ncbi:MAG: 16S rRNA (cytosine(967)-C(5))-methyltransferase RsmB [Nitrospirota bacterium]|nr:16S rRNA (cytosine(967)-C(5))-methyltransferase RsmB [Nitrospirota bacterium]
MTERSSIDRPRERALTILHDTEKGGFADPLLDASRREFEGRDSAFILELVYGVFRNRTRIDWLLDRFSAHPVSKTDAWTRNLLRLAAYQLLFLDKVPASAAVNTATELAKVLGKKSGYVNGLLRTLERNKEKLPLPHGNDPLSRLSIVYSHPSWLVNRWIKRIGPELTEEVLRQNNKPAPLILRVNNLKGNRDELVNLLEAQGAAARNTAYSPAGIELLSSPGITTLPAYRDGWFLVQDEAAQLVSMMLSPEPGEIVLDACAAPGGKATHLAEVMKNEGQVVALESDKRRIGRIRENSERLGLLIVLPVAGDASTFGEGSYDRILIDAPCSGLGVLRRHPDGRWAKTEAGIKERAALQKRIMENCAKLLKPAGILVYATCTTEPEENENVIKTFLSNNPDFTLEDPCHALPSAASKFVGDDLFFRTFPKETSMDGFFGARLKKN